MFIDLDSTEPREVFPGFRGRFLHSATMTFVQWEIDAGVSLPEHSHVHEQVARILDGEFELTIGDATQRLTRGMMAVIPSGVAHSGRALSACRILDVFHPIREDYR